MLMSGRWLKARREPREEKEVHIQDQRAHAVPFTTQTRLTFDVVLPLWGHRGPPQPAGVWPLAPCERCPAPFCRRPAHVLDGVRGAAYQSVLAAEPSENTWFSTVRRGFDKAPTGPQEERKTRLPAMTALLMLSRDVRGA